MSHTHSHGGITHSHDGGHSHHHHAEFSSDEKLATDLSVDDADLTPMQMRRRTLLRTAGVLGAGAATAALVDTHGAATAAAVGKSRTSGAGHRAGWLSGDHHIHTQYSSDGMYQVNDQVAHAEAYGLDWMVITDHGSATHAKIGVDKVNPDILAARKRHQDMLVFQGLEWNIPAAEHGTVIVHPGAKEVSVLKQFENNYDGAVMKATANTPENEALAVKGVQFLGSMVDSREVRDALFLANHPARNGIDSPHEVRGWRDANPEIAIGWEGAPGHQAAGISADAMGPGDARGYYGNAPGANSFAGYVPESYRTWGGFDFYTATVGGLWDSLLAEGKGWWISANSDSHSVYLDTAVRGGGDFATQGRYNDPIYGGKPQVERGDYWPGYYSRTNVGSNVRNYAGVMQGMRAGNVWVDHGRLIEDIDVRVSVAGSSTSAFGGVVMGRRGQRAKLTIRVVPAQVANWATFIPKLAKLDVIKGAITGPVTDRDTLHAPQTKVVKTWDVSGHVDAIEVSYDLGVIEEQGFYVRLRGSDGNRTQAGYFGADFDPAGPAIDVVGDADPWTDLWFYTNPIFVLPR
ncbi:PHP domain-containing protein [Luteococcus sanguinis]|uniref:PHP domain-containing protein n=1 Tax=Luteococcus sanguinis TaxID=174038 RepID=A0ABW1X2X9_9ACTN